MHRLRAIAPDVVLSGAVILLIGARLLLTRKGFAASDIDNDLWASSVAGKSLVEAGHPTYFINTAVEGVFEPFFAFYGGTLFMATGAVSELLGGHPIAAFLGVTLLAITGAYVGTLWLGRQFGLRGWVAHAPAVAVVTSAYYITDLYGRGDWSEFVAISAIAPLAASAIYLTRAPLWRPWPVLVFVVSAVAFTGSHNITLLWGATVALVALLVLWLVMGRPRELPYRRLAMVAALGVTSALVNSWFLLTDIAHGHDVQIYAIGPSAKGLANGTSFFDTPSVLFNPLRHVPAASTTPALYVQAPVWFLVWGLLAGSLLLHGGSARLRRVWVGATIVVALLLAALMLKPFWEHLPNPWTQIQFPYRLNGYVLYAIAALVLVGALALQRASTDGPKRATRFLRYALAAVTAISLGLCLWQQWHPKPVTNLREALTNPHVLPRTWSTAVSYYADYRAPVISTPPGRQLIIPPSQVRGDHFAAVMNVPPGPQPIQTNIVGGNYVVRISGLEWLGRTPSGYAVVRRPNGGSAPVRVTVGTASSRAITLGRVLSVLALIALLVVLVGTSFRASARGDLSGLAARGRAFRSAHTRARQGRGRRGPPQRDQRSPPRRAGWARRR
jgi:hypothetical protein